MTAPATAVHNANGRWQPERDVRDHSRLLAAVRSRPQRSVLWPLVAARRAGKTWTLLALEHALRAEGRGARFVDLRLLDDPNANGRRPLPPEPTAAAGATGEIWLLDEPELCGTDTTDLREPADLVAWCKRAHAAGATVVLACSPAEWAAMLAAPGAARRLLFEEDLHHLDPLTPDQAARIPHTADAATTLALLPPPWLRCPFLVELVFQMLDERRSRGAPPPVTSAELVAAAVRYGEDARFFYFDQVFGNGLSALQQTVIRAVALGDPLPPSDEGRQRAGELLKACGLLNDDPDRGLVVADPVLDFYLRPLRIHHVSDVHFGPKAAERTDVKEKGAHGGAMKQALGAGVAWQYVQHLKESSAARAPHVLVVSGDLVEWSNEQQWQDARAFITAATEALADHPLLPADAPRVLVAGGNHDVDWSAVKGPAGARQRHLAFARALAGLPRLERPRLEEPPDSRTLAAASYRELGVEIALLGSAELGGEPEGDPVRDGLLDLVARLRDGAMSKADEDKADELRRTVSRIDPGLVHHRDLERVRRHAWKLAVRIAVLHHPVSPLPSGTEVTRYAGLVNAAEVKATLLEKQFALALHGHAHSGWFGAETWPGLHDERVLRIAAAPSLGSREVQEKHGYNEILVWREREDGKTVHRVRVTRFVRDGGGWRTDAIMGPFAPCR